MGCDFFGGDVGRVGRECCLDWTVVRPLPSVQRMESATGKLWDLRGWAVIVFGGDVGRVGRECCLDWTVIFGDWGDGL